MDVRILGEYHEFQGGFKGIWRGFLGVPGGYQGIPGIFKEFKEFYRVSISFYHFKLVKSVSISMLLKYPSSSWDQGPPLLEMLSHLKIPTHTLRDETENRISMTLSLQEKPWWY